MVAFKEYSDTAGTSESWGMEDQWHSMLAGASFIGTMSKDAENSNSIKALWKSVTGPVGGNHSLTIKMSFSDCTTDLLCQ